MRRLSLQIHRGFIQRREADSRAQRKHIGDSLSARLLTCQSRHVIFFLQVSTLVRFLSSTRYWLFFFFLDETGSSATFVAEEKKVFPHFLTRTLSLCLVSCEGTLDSANVYSLDLETVHSWSFAETAQSLVWSSKKSYLISSRSKFGQP